MSDLEKIPDGISWQKFPVGEIYYGDALQPRRPSIFHINIKDFRGSTWSELLFTDGTIRLWEHKTMAKDKLAGYSIGTVRFWDFQYFKRPSYVSIFSDCNSPHTQHEQLFASKHLRLFRFQTEAKSFNYCFTLREYE